MALPKTPRSLLRSAVPFPVRVRWQQLRRHAQWNLHPQNWATGRGVEETFPVALDERSSPLARASSGAMAATADGKERNLALGCQACDRLVIAPGEVFSFCRTVGPTTRRRGFAPGLEMHDFELTRSPGGGLCQLANLLFALAVAADAEIVERHRHTFDLFPDVERTVPFGFGATVFYNYIDLQFRNTLETPLMLRLWLDGGRLHGRMLAAACPGWRIRVVETGHRFFREDGKIWRENQLWKQRIPTASGVEEAAPVPLFATRAVVLYPADHLVDAPPAPQTPA